MSDEKPRFKPNVSGAGARRGRRTRIAQLVPQEPAAASARSGSGPAARGRGRGVVRTIQASDAAGPGVRVKTEQTMAKTGTTPVAKSENKFASDDPLRDPDSLDIAGVSVKDPCDEMFDVGDGFQSSTGLKPVSLPFPDSRHLPVQKHSTIAGALLDEERVSILQLPGTLPLQLPTPPQKQTYEAGEEEDAGSANTSMQSDLRKLTGESMLLGKLRVYRSGKVNLVFGNSVEMNIGEGADPHFHQHLLELNETEKTAIHAAEVNDRFIVVPDLNSILSKPR